MRTLMDRAVPIISTRLVQNLGFFLGSLMVAQLGRDALAASAIATSLSLCSFTFASSSLMLVAPMLSSLGKADSYEERWKVMGRGFCAANILGLACALFIFLLTLSLPWWPTNVEIKTLLRSYFLVMIPGYFPMLWTAVLQQYLLGTKRAPHVLGYAVARLIVGTIISYLCIFGIPGLFPGLGFHGLALGVMLGSVAGFMGLGWTVFRLDDFREIVWRKLLFIDRSVGTYLRKAIPIGFMSSLELAAFAAGVQLLTPLGVTALGAHQIVFQFVMLSTMIPYGLCDAVSISVGEARGQGEPARIPAIVNAAQLCSLLTTGGISLIYLVAPKALAMLFLHDHTEGVGATLDIVVPYFRIIAFYQILDGIRLIHIGALRGQLRTSEAFTTSVLAFWVVALPLASILIYVFHQGALSLPIGLLLGMWVGTVSINRVYKKGLEPTL